MKNAMIRSYGQLVIDLAQYRVFLQGRPLALPYREYALLVYLSMRLGKVVSRRQLLFDVLGGRDPGGARTVDERIRHLKMLIERGGQKFIQRSDGGYAFIAEETADA